MIYLVTRQQGLFTDDTLYKKVSVDKVIEYLESVEETGFDSETTGLDCHVDSLYCVQVGDKNDQYVIDCTSIDVKVLKRLLETRLLILQNGKFDLKFLYKKGIYPRKVFDTYVTERVLYCGIDSHRAGLDFLAERYLGIKLDKSQQNYIHLEGLTGRNIKYAAGDVAVLHDIREKQTEALQAKGLTGTAALENRFTPCLAYIEYCGFKLDINRWKAKMKKDDARLQKATSALNEWVISRNLTEFLSKQISLFEPAACNINWSSSKQVIELFEELGINCTFSDHGIKRKSAEADFVKKQAADFPVISLYLEYRAAERVTSGYGQNFVDQVNTVTKRLHTQFNQITSAGRLSCGGKDKTNKPGNINFQGIPKDEGTRACFISERGNTLVICDYEGQEQIVLANRCLDPELLEFYDSGIGDMHSFVASKIFPQLEGLPVDAVKACYRDEREAAKGAGFPINYGGSGKTIADNLGIPEEKGNAIYDAYFAAFPGLKKYFEESKKQGLRDGYILISPVTGRKSYIPLFEQYKALKQSCNGQFWAAYRKAKQNSSAQYEELRKTSSAYFKMKGDIERSTLSTPIQGCAAEIIKISGIYIFDHIVENNLVDTVLFTNMVHDENVLECPDTMAQKIADVVRDAMRKAGEIYCKRVPLAAEPVCSKFWKK